MATRQEIALGLNLMVNINRVNNWMPRLATRLDAVNDVGTEKGACSGFATLIKDTAGALKTVLTKAPESDIAMGLAEYAVLAEDANDDVDSGISVSDGIVTAINLASTTQALKDVAALCDNHTPKVTAVANPKDLPEHIQHAISLHYLLDAMSCELQGTRYHNNTSHGFSFNYLKELESQRVRCGYVLLSHTIGTDNEEFGDILNYIDANIRSASSLSELLIVGEYIDSNLGKLICVKRHWAL